MQGKIYMGGICGMGMSPLASFLKKEGFDVFGFDDAPNADIGEMLEEESIEIRHPEVNEQFDTLVISSALRERIAELKAKYPFAEILLRGEMWAKMCTTRRLVAVVGSHGKSTVSAMLTHAALKAKKDLGWFVGAIPRDFKMSGHCKDGDILISEIDESDGTIEGFAPEVCVALNADLDHVDTYADNTKLSEMFERIFARTSRAIIYPASDPTLSRLASLYPEKARPVEYGEDFNQTNIAMASAAFEAIFQDSCPENSFEDFGGLARRQEIISDTPSLFAISDYAHHPNEVKAFLEWLDKRYPVAKTVIFQPHRYTRTKYFRSLFARILQECVSRGNNVILMPVYPASEPFDSEGSSERIAEIAKDIKLANRREVCEILRNISASDSREFVAFVGAGDFHFQAREILKNIHRDEN